MKKCNKCKKIKEHTLEFFYAQKNGFNGLRATCKDCNSFAQKIRSRTPEAREKHRLSMVQYRKDNPEKTLEISRRNYKNHGKKHNATRRERYANDPEFKQKIIDREKIYVESGRRKEMNSKPEQRIKARERNRKRRLIPEKKEHDYSRGSEWREENRDRIKWLNEKKRDNLEPSYIACSMRLSVKDLTPEIIETKQLIIKIKRVLKQNNVKIR